MGESVTNIFKLSSKHRITKIGHQHCDLATALYTQNFNFPIAHFVCNIPYVTYEIDHMISTFVYCFKISLEWNIFVIKKNELNNNLIFD